MHQSLMELKDWTDEEEYYARHVCLAGHYSIFLELPKRKQQRILDHINKTSNNRIHERAQ